MRRLAWVFFLALLLAGCAEQWDLVTKLREQQLEVQETDRGVVVTLPYVFFSFGSADLSPEARKTVDAMAVILNHPRAEKRNLSIEGHSDAVGKTEDNVTLSKARAETVANELIVNNLRRERVTTFGYGESRPVAPNANPDGTDNPEGRARNRRVEIVIEKE
ncbi:MAG: OmpA family protein [Deltaproteobacteria bacterium]|nr:OmpA family protein [Deltaproteobacteria bacterium]